MAIVDWCYMLVNTLREVAPHLETKVFEATVKFDRVYPTPYDTCIVDYHDVELENFLKEHGPTFSAGGSIAVEERRRGFQPDTVITSDIPTSLFSPVQPFQREVVRETKQCKIKEVHLHSGVSGVHMHIECQPVDEVTVKQIARFAYNSNKFSRTLMQEMIAEAEATKTLKRIHRVKLGYN